MVEAVTLPATKGMGGSTGSAISKIEISGLPTILERQAAFGGTLPLPPARQPLPPEPPIAPTPTTSFESQWESYHQQASPSSEICVGRGISSSSIMLWGTGNGATI